MAVTHDDVMHIAELARLSVPAARIEHLVQELNGILGHMDVLSQVETRDVDQMAIEQSEGTPLRSDTSGPIPLLAPIASFAPEIRDGFFIVPRLATHEDGEDRTP